MPGAGGAGQDPDDGPRLWRGAEPPYREIGVDANWANCFNVVDENGNIVETWSQWDKIFKRPHAVYVSPYDPDKNVWVVDDHMFAVYKFTHDGKQLLQTIGTPGVEGADATHFNRPTYISWLPNGDFFIADGYNGTRVAKFDKDGKFLLDWGKAGCEPGKIPAFRATSRTCTASPSIRKHITSSSMTAATTASRSSTKWANISTSGRWATIPPTCT